MEETFTFALVGAVIGIVNFMYLVYIDTRLEQIEKKIKKLTKAELV